MKSKIITSITLLLLLIGPTSCFFFEKCPDIERYFKINGLDLYNTKINSNGAWEYVKESEEVKWNKFFIRARFDETYYSQQKNYYGSELFALSCDESGYAGSQVGIDTLYLITLKNYNQVYHQNDTLNKIILTNYFTSYVEGLARFFPLSDYIKENKDGILQHSLELKVNEPPSPGKQIHQFKLVFILKNGETFIQETNPLTLTN